MNLEGKDVLVHAEKAYGEMELQLHSPLTLAPDGGKPLV
jgi:hypothetical protein